MKRLIVCCDGTRQSQDNECPTNVLKISQAIKPIAKDKMGKDIPQVIYYDEGIGTVSKKREKEFFQIVKDGIEYCGGGWFGWWIDYKIQEAYRFLCLNYLPGDEIYLFGFSRGAYTVRSLAGLINCSGLLKSSDICNMAEAYEIYRIKDENKQKEKAKKFRQTNAAQQVEIKFLGCWDTVKALGIPDLISWLGIDRWFNEKYEFHNTKLSPIIQNSRHAIAIDEKRKAFDVTIMEPGKGFNQTLEQVWFPGDHGCVGGGDTKTLGLSNAALKWMAEQASQLGLDLSLAKEITDKIDSKTSFTSARSMLRFIGLGWLGEHNRNITNLKKLGCEIKFHSSVRERWDDPDMDYHPKNLEEFFKSPGVSRSQENVPQEKNYQLVR